MSNEHLDKYRELISEVLAQAVEDFMGLRSRGAIRNDHSINESLWIKRDDGSTQRPLNIDSPTDAMELVWFFEDASLDRLCAFVGIPACRIRTKLGFQPEAVAERCALRMERPNLQLEDRAVARFEKTRYRFL